MTPKDEFDDFLLQVGKLNYAWTNTESLLIHFIAGLVRTDIETATVIFLTLNTSRARMDLVNRLSKLGKVAKEEQRQILALTDRIQKIGRLRNRYNHCIYAFDSNAEVSHTILMRIADRKDGIKMGQVEAINDETTHGIAAAIAELGKINRASWAFLHAFDYPR
ncbi:hypothetical protein N9824_00275 [bacterium]|nr:hypothetical protein [Yoonia sp.]MDB4245960.1 hypothetical protein [bacterium]